MICIGVDPGKSGGFALINTETNVAKTFPWDDTAFIETMKAVHSLDVVACVEKVGAMPGQGVTSMFNFGHSAGFIHGVLSAFDIPYQLVPPQKWKKEYSLGPDKEQAIKACERLFPNVSLLATPRCRKPSDGMAEALLMAEYARRNL
jgi:crossover junction endodeoxyribonuclease RuvC